MCSTNKFHIIRWIELKKQSSFKFFTIFWQEITSNFFSPVSFQKTFKLSLRVNSGKYFKNFLLFNIFVRRKNVRNDSNYTLFHKQNFQMQHPEAELLLFKNCSHCSSSLSSTNKSPYSKKNKQKNKCVCFQVITLLIIMKIEMEMKNRSHRYDINRRSSRNKSSKYKKCLSMMLLICVNM